MTPDIAFLLLAPPRLARLRSKIGACTCRRQLPKRSASQDEAFSMSVVPDRQDKGVKAGGDYEIRGYCSHPNSVVAEFIRSETGWYVTNDEVGFLLNDQDLVAVLAVTKKSSSLPAGDLIGTVIAVPTRSPFVSTSPAYFITNVIVAKSHRRNGIARRMVDEVIQICEQDRQ